jgi:hypothetical protein
MTRNLIGNEVATRRDGLFAHKRVLSNVSVAAGLPVESFVEIDQSMSSLRRAESADLETPERDPE